METVEEDKSMLELTGMAAIAGVVTGSMLLALFISETLIAWIIRAMHAGVKRADAAAAQMSEKSATAKLALGQRPRLQRV